MSTWTKQQDAFGQEIDDYFHGRGGFEIIERDDGYVDLSSGPSVYFAEYKDWPPHQKQAIRLARGRVLDVGCGAGRVALYLQSKGLDVTGTDNSPLAIQVCKVRGVKKAKVLPITQVNAKMGVWDTIVMFGNNFGLFGDFRRARWLLRRFAKITGPGGRILAESNDPYQTTQRDHLEYHKRNRRRGRMSGQLRIRVRYRTHATPFFDYLLASKEEVAKIVDGTGWKIERFFDSKGSLYAVLLEKE
jgi:SAM-dependent methyltransferase